ncbi:MAG: hypothetical protein ACTHLT_15135 [Devosia sp.]
MAEIVSGFAGSAGFHPHLRSMRRLRAFWRIWRLRQARRAMLLQVLAETSDPRLIEEAGLAAPAPSGLELFARALLWHRP